MGKIKYKDVDLTEEEYKDAVFNRDHLKIQLDLNEFNLKTYKKEIELKIPQRKLEQRLKENLEKMEQEVETLKENLKVFERQVRTKKKEVPFQEEESCEVDSK
jgi:hypothetical protein